MKYKCKYCSNQSENVLDLASKINIKTCLPLVSIISKGMILPRKTGIKNAPYQGGGGYSIRMGTLLMSQLSMI